MRAEVTRSLEVLRTEVFVDAPRSGDGRLGPAQLLGQEAGGGVRQALVLPNPAPRAEPSAARWRHGPAAEEQAVILGAHDPVPGDRWCEVDNVGEGFGLQLRGHWRLCSRKDGGSGHGAVRSRQEDLGQDANPEGQDDQVAHGHGEGAEAGRDAAAGEPAQRGEQSLP